MGPVEFKSKKHKARLSRAITMSYTETQSPQPDSSDFSTFTLLELLISLMEQILLRGNLFSTSPSTRDCQSIRNLST